MRHRTSRREIGTSSLFAVARAAAGVVVLVAAQSARGQSGLVEVLAVEGQAAPGLAGVTIPSINLSNVSRSGHAVMSATLSGTGVTSANDSTIMRFGGGSSVVIIAREGQLLPGIGNLTSPSPGSVNAAGQVAIFGFLTNTAGGTTDNVGLYVTSDGATFAQMFRKGTPAIGTFTYSGFSSLQLTESGRVYTNATLAGSGITTVNDRVMAVSNGISTSTFLREGFGSVGASYFYDRPNVLGQISILNDGTNAQSGKIYLVYPSGAVDQLVSETDDAPGNGTLGAFIDHTTPNAVGQVAFLADLANTASGTTDDRGLYVVSPGTTPVQIARKGQAAPGGGTFTSISSFGPALSDGGRVAFAAIQSGSPNGSLDGNSIFTGTGGSLTRIARSGQFFDASQTTKLSNLVVESITSTGTVFFYGYIIDAATDAFVRDSYFLGDGTEFLEIAPRGTALAGSTISGLLGNGGSSRFLDDGRFIGMSQLADSRDVIYQFTPSLRYRTASSGSWDTASNWTVSLRPSAVHDVRIDPTISLTVNGPSAPVTVKSLTVGGGTGIATLRLTGGSISATSGVTVTATGALTGEGGLVGNVVNSGVITPTAITISSGSLTNSGVVRGSVPGSTVYPTITAGITNTAVGEVRLVAGEYLRVAGAHFRNQGRVEVVGLPTAVTQLEFDSPVTNVASSGLITTRSGILRFDGGLLNQGSLSAASGINEVFGDITNAAGGSINITGGAQANFYDDVVTNGTLRVAKSGSTTSVAVFMGSFSGAGAITGGGDVFFEGDLRPGNSPAFVNFDANVSFGPGVVTFMELGGLGDGQYDRITVSGVLALDGVLDVRFLAGLEPSGGTPVTYRLLQAGALVGDFDSILLPTLVGRDWFVQRTDTSLTIGSFTVIPEPGVVGVLAVGVGLVGIRRRR